jgi:hypothetical protein
MKLNVKNQKSLERKESWPFEKDIDTELNKILDNCGRKKVTFNIDC